MDPHAPQMSGASPQVVPHPAHALGQGQHVHEGLLASLIIFGFSLGVLAFYFAVLFALGQAKGIF